MSICSLQWQYCSIAGVTAARWTQIHLHAGQSRTPALQRPHRPPTYGTHALDSMHGTATAVAVVQQDGCVPQVCVWIMHVGTASADYDGMAVLQSKSYGCSPSSSVCNCCRGFFWQKTCAYQRATVKRNPLGCEICCGNKFQQGSIQQEASTAACLTLSVAPNCHPLCSPCCLLPLLRFA